MKPASDSPRPSKEARLAALKALKATTCFCSECGSKLRFRSFKAHPCYKEAVQRHGKWRASQRVYRLDEPPSSPSPPTSAGLKRSRSPSLEEQERPLRDVRPRYRVEEARADVLKEDLAAFGTSDSSSSCFCRRDWSLRPRCC